MRRRHLCHTDIRAESTQVSGVYSDRELMGTEGMGSAGRAPRGPLKDFGFILTLKETNRGLRAGEDIAWLTSSRKSPCLAARGQWPSWCPQSALFPFKSHFSVKCSCVRSPPVCLQEQGPCLTHCPPLSAVPWTRFLCSKRDQKNQQMTHPPASWSLDFQAVLGCMHALPSSYRITGISLSVLKQIDPSEQKTLANLPWIVEPGQEAKRGINTKYETTIFWYSPPSCPRGALHAEQSRSRLSTQPGRKTALFVWPCHGREATGHSWGHSFCTGDRKCNQDFPAVTPERKSRGLWLTLPTPTPGHHPRYFSWLCANLALLLFGDNTLQKHRGSLILPKSIKILGLFFTVSSFQDRTELPPESISKVMISLSIVSCKRTEVTPLIAREFCFPISIFVDFICNQPCQIKKTFTSVDWFKNLMI